MLRVPRPGYRDRKIGRQQILAAPQALNLGVLREIVLQHAGDLVEFVLAGLAREHSPRERGESLQLLAAGALASFDRGRAPIPICTWPLPSRDLPILA